MTDITTLIEQSSMDHWWPKIGHLEVPEPKTVPIPCEEPGEEEGFITGLAPETAKVKEAVVNVGGPPAFLRTDQSSAKHQMERASQVRQLSHVGRHVHETLDCSMMATSMVKPETFYVREWLDLYAEFEAFEGCPVAAELRFFIDDGEVHDCGFYWPEESIRRASEPGWEELLEVTETTAFDHSFEAREIVTEVASQFPEGYWSVDLALDIDMDWYVIDMARGELSWHPDSVERLHEDPRTR